MQPRSTAAAALIVSGALLLLVGTAGLQRARELWYPLPPVSAETLYLTSGNALKRLTAGYNALAADVYWIRSIQYFGGIRRRLAEPAAAAPGRPASPDAAFELLYPMLDITTTLDPFFNIAYRFGAIFLTEPFPSGAGRPDLAIALLTKGLAARPDKWEYMQDIGYVHYWWLQDYATAAEWFRRASEVPGAPWFMRSLYAATLAEGGNRQSSRVMWESILQSAELEWQRNDAQRRLRQLDILDAIDRLQQVADAAAARLGRPPASWQEVVGLGLIRGLPVDAEGLPFELDPSGRVVLSARSQFHPLPVEPKRLGPPVLP
jgi:hypothetical protein